MEESYKVKTEVFEGPLELLLDLIEKRKLFINEISLAKIADDYIGFVRQMERFPTAEIASFILVASTLILIKSKSLLPSLSLTDEEQSDISDLEDRLKLYQKIKELSGHIKNIFGKRIIFSRLQNKIIEPVFSPDSQITLKNILEAARDVLKNLPKPEALPKAVVKKIISLEEVIENLTERIKSGLKMSFRNFSNIGKQDKVTVIVSFLAMLELVKQGIIQATQEKLFEDIDMETQDLAVPRYD